MRSRVSVRDSVTSISPTATAKRLVSGTPISHLWPRHCMTSTTQAISRQKFCRCRTATPPRDRPSPTFENGFPNPDMLKHQLIHPKINEVLGRAGHHSKILIADGNYPASTKKGPNAELVSLNLAPGVVNCTQVLRAILSAVPIDGIHTMMYTADDPYKIGRAHV